MSSAAAPNAKAAPPAHLGLDGVWKSEAARQAVASAVRTMVVARTHGHTPALRGARDNASATPPRTAAPKTAGTTRLSGLRRQIRQPRARPSAQSAAIGGASAAR